MDWQAHRDSKVRWEQLELLDKLVRQEPRDFEVQ